MIGNDVVDLALAKVESTWQRKGYLEKLFTLKEQKLISESKNQTEIVWILWSRKEAVYKIIRQQNGERGFYPLRIENLEYEFGVVCFEKVHFYVKTTIVDDCIHSIALPNQSFDKIIEISPVIPLQKKNEIPFVTKNARDMFVSKSHHGRFEKTVGLIDFQSFFQL